MVSFAQSFGSGEASLPALSRNGSQWIAGTWSAGILNLPRSGRTIVDEIPPRSHPKCSCQVIQFNVPCVEVIADAQVQGEVLRNPPVFLEVSSDFPVSPVTDAGC